MNPLPLPETAEVLQFDAYRSRSVERWRDGTHVWAIDQVAEEVPVAMVYNGISHAVMLATPTGLEQFGLGFSLSEGILRDRRELYDIEIVQQKEGVELQMTISPARFADLKQRRRSLAGRTGCGLCGTESLKQVCRHPQTVAGGAVVPQQALHGALEQLVNYQTLQMLTGATHAAAWATADGAVVHVAEDIGRHNALDKLIGTMALKEVPASAGFVIVTSRASYEMVQKAATAGIPLLAAVSAPTGLAVEMAEQTGLTLVGFTRGHSHVVYTHSHRLI